MPVLKFLCPTTRVYVDSGIRLDERSAAASRLTIVRVSCRQCHREHRFLLADGVLDSSDTLTKSPVSKKRSAKNTIVVRSQHEPQLPAGYAVGKTYDVFIVKHDADIR